MPHLTAHPDRRTVWRTLVIALFALSLLAGNHGVADASIQKYGGEYCVGARVYRCAWINYDAANNRMRAYTEVRTGHIVDPIPWEVSLLHMEVQRYGSSGWRRVSFTPDIDGWWQQWGVASRIGPDRASSSLQTCAGTQRYRVRTIYQWQFPGQPNSHGVETRTSRTFVC